MLARCLSRPAPNTHTPAFTASCTTACDALPTSGQSSSGMWSIAPSLNEIKYCVIPSLLVPAAFSGRLSLCHERLAPDPTPCRNIFHGTPAAMRLRPARPDRTRASPWLDHPAAGATLETSTAPGGRDGRRRHRHEAGSGGRPGGGRGAGRAVLPPDRLAARYQPALRCPVHPTRVVGRGSVPPHSPRGGTP